MASVTQPHPLRFIICGEPGSGKSTLLERLLAAADAQASAQTHQFTLGERSFIARETEPTTLLEETNSASLMVLVLDARSTESLQRYLVLAHLLGIREIVVVVNWLDWVGDAQQTFEQLVDACRVFTEPLQLKTVRCIPVSALTGDNITDNCPQMSWYQGPSLLAHLQSVDATDKTLDSPFRLLLQRFEPEQDSFLGPIISGSIRASERVRLLPAGKESSVTRIIGPDGDLESARSGQMVSLQLADALGSERVEVLASKDAPPGMADQFEGTIIWQDPEPMLPGRSYWLQRGVSEPVGVEMHPKYRLNVQTQDHLAAKTLEQSDIGICNLNLEHDIIFDEYGDNPALGSFTLLDRQSQRPVGVGFLHFALRRSQNIHWQAIEINKKAHAELKGQRPCVVWFTGLSGAGKSTVANLVEKKLHGMGRHTYLLDGDNVRHGLNKDLGFTEADRVENIRRIAEVAKLMVDAGLIVLTSFISPFRTERRMARDLLEAHEFCEVFIDTPLLVAEQRDTKGLYKKARRGELKNFTGIDSPYEPPENPEIHIDTTRLTPAQAAEQIVARLQAMGIVETEVIVTAPVN